MKAGDRVMVYDSPGFPLDHYLYAVVLTPSDAGAVVLIDHPGNPSNGIQKWATRIMDSAAALDLAEAARKELSTASDSVKRKGLMEQMQHHQFVAGQLS